jgi:hypothetical protein
MACHRIPAAARVAVLILVPITLGCGTQYRPRSPGRIFQVTDGWGMQYVKDGKRYRAGLFFDDLDDAVRGNVEAERFASQAEWKVPTGFLVAVGGFLCSSIAMSYHRFEEREDPMYSTPPGLIGLEVGCLVAGAVGMGVLSSGISNRMDAINLYNDTAGQPPPTRLPAAIR